MSDLARERDLSDEPHGRHGQVRFIATKLIVFQNYEEQSKHLAGPIGLLKQFITQTGRMTAKDASQMFGGRAITVHTFISSASLQLLWNLLFSENWHGSHD